MSSTKTKIEGIDTFIAKVRQSTRMGSKEIRLTAAEATDLVAAIAQVLAMNVTLADEVREVEKLVGSTLRIDGGGFD